MRERKSWHLRMLNDELLKPARFALTPRHDAYAVNTIAIPRTSYGSSPNAWLHGDAEPHAHQKRPDEVATSADILFQQRSLYARDNIAPI